MYVVNTQVVNVDDRPLKPPSTLTPSWGSIFRSKNCFSDLLHLNDSESGVSDDNSNPQAPEVQGVSQLCFNPREFRIRPKGYTDNELIELLQDVGGIQGRRSCDNLLYYCPYIDDYRISSFYFELKNPIIFEAIDMPDISKNVSKLNARGKIHAHFYPCGYAVIHVPIKLSWKGHLQLAQIKNLVSKVYPGNESNWSWASNIHEGQLHSVLEKFLKAFNQSVYSIKSKGVNVSQFSDRGWLTTLKIASDVSAKLFAKKYFNRELKKLDYLEILDDIYLLGTSTYTSFVFSSIRDNRKSLHIFWDLLSLVELSLINLKIYEDLDRFLEQEIDKLKAKNNSIFERYKISRENLRRWDYDEPSVRKFSRFLKYQNDILNRSIYLRDTHKEMIHHLYNFYGVNGQCTTFEDNLKEWENEVRVSTPTPLRIVRIIWSIIPFFKPP